uniref:Transmembrane protein 88 b n=1 Tax=Oncorhynchus tshawytscha TaxID=74940 RepID=A0A8C8F7E6_ONCTS
MSVIGTLEKGAHHQALELSEELSPLNHHHLQHSNSLASSAPVGTPSGVVVPPPYSAAESGGGGSDAPLELRGSLDCWACSVLVTAQNLVIAGINACLAGLVFGLILIPAIAMVVFGFLCHSTGDASGTLRLSNMPQPVPDDIPGLKYLLQLHTTAYMPGTFPFWE